MSKDGGRKSISRRVIQWIAEALQHLEERKYKLDPKDRGHFNAVKLMEWANGERPKDFLEKYIAHNTEHFFQCQYCQYTINRYIMKRN